MTSVTELPLDWQALESNVYLSPSPPLSLLRALRVAPSAVCAVAESQDCCAMMDK